MIPNFVGAFQDASPYILGALVVMLLVCIAAEHPHP